MSKTSETKPVEAEVKDGAPSGPNREGLDYRAGWVEALRAFGVSLQMQGLRAKRNEVAGMEKAAQIAKGMYDAMIATMSGKAEPAKDSANGG